MSEQPEARAVCEHFYASHCYRGMSVRLCMTCHEPDWDDLAGQLADAGRGSELAADPLILSPDEFAAVKTVAAVLGLPGSASEPDGPGEASTTAFQARWPVTAGVLRSQVRAAIEHWASGDAGDEDPAGVVMGAVAPFIESLVAEGLRTERARADAAEARLVKIGVLVQDTYLAEDILDIIGGEEKGADHV